MKRACISNIACVCNATYCDEFPPVGSLSSGQAAVYTTSASGKRFERTTAQFQPILLPPLGSVPVSVNTSPATRYQTIIGFGGAFTDSAGVNLNRLSHAASSKLLSAYFGPEGIGYSLGRVIMASADFSPTVYSYDDLYPDPLAPIFRG